MTRYIETIDFGKVPIRRTYTEGNVVANVELSDDKERFAEVRTDYNTNQPFAVLFDENWNQL